jgi:hypothetical protein
VRALLALTLFAGCAEEPGYEFRAKISAGTTRVHTADGRDVKELVARYDSYEQADRELVFPVMLTASDYSTIIEIRPGYCEPGQFLNVVGADLGTLQVEEVHLAVVFTYDLAPTGGWCRGEERELYTTP